MAWDDQQQQIARTGKSMGAQASQAFAPPTGGNAGGAPAAGPWQGYDPGYLGKTGGPKAGSGWGYYYADNGRDTGAGALGGLAQSFNYNETGQSDLSKSGMGRAKGLIDTGDPDALANKMYQQRENIAMRAGQAARENQLSENADQYAMRGMTGSGGEAGAAADIRRNASQARLAALDQARAESTQWGEGAATGRLDAGMPWEQSDLGRREQNTEWQNRAIDKRTDLAAAAASARGGSQEKIIEIPGYGEVPESMMPYLMGFE